jgi:hypothetical protein
MNREKVNEIVSLTNSLNRCDILIKDIEESPTVDALKLESKRRRNGLGDAFLPDDYGIEIRLIILEYLRSQKQSIESKLDEM